MCRMAAWLGATKSLSALLYDPPHSLERQAFAPRSMASGHVNVDGTGVVWWPSRDEPPLRYATERTPWADANLRRFAPRFGGGALLALVRSATPGQAFGEAAVGPFEADGLAVAHNGFIEPWHGRARRPLLDALDEDLYRHAEPGTDSQVLFLHLLQAWRKAPDAPLAQSVGDALDELSARLGALGGRARLDVLVCDGTRLAAVRRAVELQPNSMFFAERDDGVFVASEPLDGAGWTEVPSGGFLEFVHDGRRAARAR